jgi:hypothetical protein
MPATKNQLHGIVDRLPDNQVETLYRIAAALAADPLTLAILTAPPDDEPYTEQQQRHDAEAVAAIQRGEGITTEELTRQLGL